MNIEMILSSLGDMSIRASVLFLVIILTKIALKNVMTPKWNYGIWFLMVVVLVLPKLPESKASVYNYVPIQKIKVNGYIDDSMTGVLNTTEYVPYVDSASYKHDAANTDLDEMVTVNYTVNENETGVKSSNDLSWNAVLLSIWITGAVFLLSRYVFGNIRFRKRLNEFDCRNIDLEIIFQSLKTRLGIYSDVELKIIRGCKSPALFGVFNPQILIPEHIIDEFDKFEIEHILTHELMHLKSRDNLMMLVSYMITAIHWFNPLVWMFNRMMRRDCEVYCDYRVIKRLGSNRVEDYGMTLIKVVDQRGFDYEPLSLVSLTSNKKQIIGRIKSITKFEKYGKIYGVISSLLIFVLALMFLSSGNYDTDGGKLIDHRKGELATAQYEDYYQSERYAISNDVIGRTALEFMYQNGNYRKAISRSINGDTYEIKDINGIRYIKGHEGYLRISDNSKEKEELGFGIDKLGVEYYTAKYLKNSRYIDEVVKDNFAYDTLSFHLVESGLRIDISEGDTSNFGTRKFNYSELDVIPDRRIDNLEFLEIRVQDKPHAYVTEYNGYLITVSPNQEDYFKNLLYIAPDFDKDTVYDILSKINLKLGVEKLDKYNRDFLFNRSDSIIKVHSAVSYEYDFSNIGGAVDFDGDEFNIFGGYEDYDRDKGYNIFYDRLGVYFQVAYHEFADIDISNFPLDYNATIEADESEIMIRAVYDGKEGIKEATKGGEFDWDKLKDMEARIEVLTTWYKLGDESVTVEYNFTKPGTKAGDIDDITNFELVFVKSIQDIDYYYGRVNGNPHGMIGITDECIIKILPNQLRPSSYEVAISPEFDEESLKEYVSELDIRLQYGALLSARMRADIFMK